MNWIKRIRWILGPFWYRIFDDQDFLLGVEYLLGSFFRFTGYTFDNWFAGMFPMLPAVYQNDLPYVILLDVSTLHREWYTWEDFVEGTVKGHKVSPSDPTYTLGSPTDDDYVATADSLNKGWVVDIVKPVPEPSYMMNHLYKWTRTLTNGPDFKVVGNQILFYTNPEDLALPAIKVTDSEGNLKIYWKLICIQTKDVNDYPAVSGFASPELNSCADVVWDIHQNGATYYNAKKLLAEATGSVVCDEDGAINEVFEPEQGWNFIRINDKIYGSTADCNFQAGADVKKGDILFGDMKFYKGSENPEPSEIPGIRVRTDAGELVAANTRSYLIPVTGTPYYVLPLTGDTATLVEYLNICLRNSYDPRCPYIQLESDDPATENKDGKINPYKFVMQTLRRGRTCAVRILSGAGPKLDAAIDVLRKSTDMGGLLTLYVKAYSEPANVTVSGFAADAGMGVVAEEVEVAVQGQLAEARILP